jgi:NodT family efflux transporter outer membrane factor (OMF) lipoprotein
MLVAAAAALAGCALPPAPTADEIRAQSVPRVTPPSAWTGSPTPPGAPGAVADHWLATFGDAQLDTLVREALRYNTDLSLAAARVEQAAAYAKLSGSAIYPAVNAIAHGGGKMGGDGSGVNVVGLFANWEIDLWGRVRAERESGRLQYAAALADAEFARQSIAALVTKSWLLAVEARLQRGIAEEVVRSLEQLRSLAQTRARVGKGDEYDLALVQASLENARDAQRQLALALEQALRALETLVGRYPAAGVEVAAALPAAPGPVPAGLPAELLERRPDLVAAERRVAAAFNRVTEARAARLPKIALSASVSGLTSSTFVLQDRDNPVASLGVNIAAPIFNGYALEAQVEIRTAEQRLAVAEYGRVAQRAFGEVEGALSAGLAADERAAILARSVAGNARALELAQVRYRVGSGDLRAVLQQRVAVYGAQATELRMRGERLVQRVNLHLALGGSFEPCPGDTVQGAIDDAAIRFVSTRTVPAN